MQDSTTEIQNDAMNDYVLKMEGMGKSFYGTQALKDVSFKLKRGTVHALVGENGAGKSTLMKVLTGVYSSDQGTIKINDQICEILNPIDANSCGVRMIFQELSLVPTLTVSENIFLSYEPKKAFIFIDKDKILEETKSLLRQVGMSDISPYSKIQDLSVGHCQMIEIAKAISHKAQILIMDEPTASLSESETTVLFEIVENLKEQGVSIIYISHRMNEIFQIADEITVLRDGTHIITDSVKNFTMQTIIDSMIGSSVEKTFEWKPRNYQGDHSVILSVENLKALAHYPEDGAEMDNKLSFSLKKGEVLGIAGLMGSGRTEILESIFGISPMDSGRILIDGVEVKIQSPRDAIDHGIVLVPEDRRRQGLVLLHSVKDNVILPSLESLRKMLLIDANKAQSITHESIDELDVKTSGINKTIRLLSGGNQQKVVIAKWLKTDPKVLLLDEPTAGVDVGAKGEIIDIIRNFADEGRGVIIVSSELAELMAVCDRIIVLKKGNITQELLHKEVHSEEVLQHAIQQ